eukprot:m.522679 g.522679  ORF g.522679 m.522679 type:complete len:231 (-) comp21968_c0_seq3:3205-3897(-)
MQGTKTDEVDSLAEGITNITVADEYTQAEKHAVAELYHSLKTKGIPEALLLPQMVVASSLISKMDLVKAEQQYTKFLDMVKSFGIEELMPQGWDNAEGELSNLWNRQYRVCGADTAGRQVFWIAGNPVGPDEETNCVQAGILFFLSIYGTFHGLRNGITMVIDQSKDTKTYGNERKMQKTWQTFPNRPQSIMIFGCSYLKKISVNALLKFAALFTKTKILRRIRYVRSKL